MMRFTKGNLLEADVDAVVNTVNTVGVMGKGIALMFKERFPENFKAYAAACKRGEVKTGQMFVTASPELKGPRWIINFPTKKHWRQRTRLEWIEQGLEDLRRVIEEKRIHSIAIPPLGCGNGGLDWSVVKSLIETALSDLGDIEIVVFEPTAKYQNVAKRKGVQKLTAARALIADAVRRYGVLGLDCSLLEIQKLAWFLERVIKKEDLENPLDLQFEADRYGPHANRLTHLLDALDGSYLHCDKRLGDASPYDTIRFDESQGSKVDEFLSSGDAVMFEGVIQQTDLLIDGFQSPLGMEALATVDWLLEREGAEPTLGGVRTGLANWPAGREAAERKQKVFSDKLLLAALTRLQTNLSTA